MRRVKDETEESWRSWGLRLLPVPGERCVCTWAADSGGDEGSVVKIALWR